MPEPYEATEPHELVCPVCRSRFGDEYTELGIVHYWTPDDLAELDCAECGAEFTIAEHVKRTWTVTLTDPDTLLAEAERAAGRHSFSMAEIRAASKATS